MGITITGGMQFTGGLSTVASPAFSMNNNLIEIKDSNTMTTTTYGFTEIVDFTRASAATYTNSSGLITTTPASKNLFTYTQELDNAAWSKQNVTITPNTTVAPNNTTTADTIVATASTALHLVSQGPNVVSGTTYTFSIYAKAGTHSFVQLALNFAAFGAVYANFNLTTGTVGNSSGASPTITNITGGWYRCTVTAAATASGNGAPGIALVSSNTAARLESWTTVGTETIIVWGEQLEENSSATSYTRNYGSVYPPRFDYDPVTLQPKGFLVEEQRTNLLLYSDQFDNVTWTKTNSSVSTNTTTAPDGTSSADTVTATVGTGVHRISRSATLSTVAAASIYAKAGTHSYFQIYDGFSTNNYATFNLATGTVGATGSNTVASVQSVGNGWFRCSVVYGATNPPNGNTLFGLASSDLASWGSSWTAGGTETVYLWGAQLEAGSFATSYIPTTASTVTRAADVASISGATFSQWYNQSEGTFVVSADSVVPTSTNVYGAVSVSDDTGNNQSRVFIYNSRWGGSTTVANVNQTDLQVAGSYSAGVSKTSAYAYKADDFAFTSGGAAVLTDLSGSLPTVNQLGIAYPTNPINGHIRSITYYPYRLTNAQLQSLTI